jgi:hypothetical protein
MNLLSNKIDNLKNTNSLIYKIKFLEKINILLLVFFFHPIIIFSQKGKKLIQEEKYSQAYVYLNKNLSKDTSDIESNYYLSLLYIQEKANEYFSINFAHEYYIKTMDLYNSLNDGKSIEKLKNKDITEATINLLHDSIINVGYRIARSKNNEQSYIDFIQLDNEIPDHLIKEAINNRNNCAFNEAKKINTISSYNSYLLKYPNTIHQIHVIDLRDSLVYIDVKKQNTISSYELFIDEHPKSSLINDANNKIDELLYNQIINENSIEKCYTLIRKSPKSKYIDSVNTILEKLKYNELLNHLSISEIESFNNEFPNSFRKNKLLITLDSLYDVKLKNDSVFWFSGDWKVTGFNKYPLDEGGDTPTFIEEEIYWNLSLKYIEDSKIECEIYCEDCPFQESYFGSFSRNNNAIDFFFNDISGTISFNEGLENINLDLCKKNLSMRFEKMNDSQIRVVNFGCKCSQFLSSINNNGASIILNK